MVELGEFGAEFGEGCGCCACVASAANVSTSVIDINRNLFEVFILFRGRVLECGDLLFEVFGLGFVLGGQLFAVVGDRLFFDGYGFCVTSFAFEFGDLVV